MQYLLGIEISRANLEICLFDEPGKLVSKTGYPIEIPQNSSGIRELIPEIWWEKTVQGIQKVITDSKVDSADITVIGFSGFHGCPVLTDANGKPTRKAIFHPEKNYTFQLFP